MSFAVLDEKKKLTKLYADEVIQFCSQVEGTLLQNDKKAIIEENIVSIGIASFFMWIVGFVVTFTGAGVILFFIGLILSRGINNKVYGKERNVENISEEEKLLIGQLTLYSKKIKGVKIKIGIKSQCQAVLFTDYGVKRAEAILLFDQINKLDTRHLTLKYRAKYQTLKRIPDRLCVKFDKAYQIQIV